MSDNFWKGPVHPHPVSEVHGHRATFAAVFDEHYAQCLAFATGLVGDRAAAEDAVQDAFLSLWHQPPLLRDKTAARSYVLRTIASKAQGKARRDARRRALEPVSPESREQDWTVDLDLQAALSRLPPRQRACALLRLLFDFSERDTAEVLGISVGTVKSQTHRAVTQLRRELVGHEPLPEGQR
jgi:RNA polymerase sigma factor (sigma-70 family)